MKKEKFFPCVRVGRTEDEKNPYEAAAALRLKSILQADLLYVSDRAETRPDDGKTRPWAGRRTDARESLLHAVSAWPQGLSLDLRVAAVPNIGSRPNGDLSISILIRAGGTNRDVVRQRVVSAFLSLNPILQAHLGEAEFEPVFDREELEYHLRPFSPAHGVSIGRIEERISLSRPFRGLSIGFGPQTVTAKTGGDHVIEHTYPWRPSHDDWSILLNTMMGQMDSTELIVRVRPRRPAARHVKRLRANILTCERFLEGVRESDTLAKRQAVMIRDCSLRELLAIGICSFDLGVYLVGKAPVDGALANLAGRSITRSATDHDRPLYFEGGFRVSETDPETARSLKGAPGPAPYSLIEAACAFRLPDPPERDIPGLPVRRSRTNLACLNGGPGPGEEQTRLFINAHQGITQMVAGGMEDRFRHMFIIGQTGTGKSAFMEGMILQDIRAGRGVAVLDPHGDMVLSILGKIPGNREKDVIFFDMLDREMPLGFNLLQWRSIEERDLIIDELYLTLDRIYDLKYNGGPIFEQNFRGMLKLLMGTRRDGDFVPTLLEFTLCYQQSLFRLWLKDRRPDSQTLDFVNELEDTDGDLSIDRLSPYITSKFNRFIHDTTLRGIVGQEKTSFDFEEIMNGRKILLVNFGKGRFGPNASALLANQMVTRFKHAAMKRGEMKAEEREPFFLYVDECHNLPSENFCELLSEARKFRMGLVLATQYAGQIRSPERESDLLSAVLGNVGTVAIFRLGHEDALRLEDVLYPSFTSRDIVGLPNWEGYVRMQANGQTTPPFSFRTELDAETYSDTGAARIRKMSRQRYGRAMKEVENAILRRRYIYLKGEEEAEDE